MKDQHVEQIPIDQIHIANPRSRSQGKWQLIVANIREVGLKKPITVVRRKELSEDGKQFDLVCGQGRIEAFIAPSETTIPAIIIEASREDQFLMSLVENIARRRAPNREAVADVGAGSGWFTVRAAARVGPSGEVYAEDINPGAIDYIKSRAAKEHLSNVQAILGEVTDTRLPRSSIDAVLILKTYHEFEHPIPLMKRLRESLRPGAKIGIIGRNGNGSDHGLMPDIVEREMSQAGYHRIGQYDFTKDDGQDYFLIFAAD